MARLLTTGFEVGFLDLADPGVGEGQGWRWATAAAATNASITAAAARTGSYGMRNLGIGRGDATVANPGTQGRSYYMRFYTRLGGTPTAQGQLVSWFDGTVNVGRMFINTDRTITITDSANVQIGSASSALDVDKWYRVEFSLKTTGVGNATQESAFRIDGTTIASTTTGPGSLVTTSAITGIVNGTTGVNIDFDDYALNDDTGSDQNSWPGPGRIYLLKPVADSARDAGWTDNAGGTSNLYQGVDNRPPVGEAPLAGFSFPTGAVHTGNPTTSASITLPTTAAGDILLLVAVNGGATAALTTGGTFAEAWTTTGTAGAGTAQWGGSWWARCTGNHTGQTVTVATATDSCSAGICIVRGAIASGSPIDTNTSTANLTANGLDLAAFTTTVTNTLVVLAMGADDNISSSGQTVGGNAMTEQFDAGSTGGADSQVMLATRDQAAAGTTGAFAGTHASTLSKRVMGFAIKPLAATAASQVKNAVSTTTENYDASVQSYTEAGVDPGTIRVVQALTDHGSSAVSAISGAVKAVSNPADSGEVAVNTDALVIGAFPTNWEGNRGNVVYNPSVVRETRPVVRAGKRTATTNVYHVDLMGLYVDVEPSKATTRAPVKLTSGVSAATGQYAR